MAESAHAGPNTITSIDPARFAPPTGFVAVADRLEGAGFEAWAVGGCIRDIHAGKVAGPPREVGSDWDLATSATPDEVMGLFPRTVPVGVAHGTVGVFSDGTLYEVTTFRRDVETDGRHAKVRFARTIEEDLRRRDFTINAIAWRPRSGDIRDPHGGLADLTARVLRAVGEPADRFREDYLRVLRGFRFAGRFDLEVETLTDEAMRRAVPGLAMLSGERVREELMKVLADPAPSVALDLYATRGALAQWYPELLTAAADRERWLAVLSAVDAISDRRPLVRLARWLAQVADEPHRRVSAMSALLSRLRFSNAHRRAVTELVDIYAALVGPSDSSAQQRRWLSRAGEPWRDAFRMRLADARAGRSEATIREVIATWRRVHDTWLEHPPLRLADLSIGGDEILGLGLEPGPLVRRLLDELLGQVLEEPGRNERQRLLGESRRLIELGALGGAPDQTDG